MDEPPYTVGYGRPPEHTRFKKGQSGNPGGRPGPEKRLTRQFRAAIGGAFESDKWELKDARPRKLMEALARKIALDALDGRPSAQRLLLSIIGGEDPQAADSQPGNDERLRQILGDRYDSYKARFDAAVASGNRDELQAIGREIELLEIFPQSGNSAGTF